MDKMSMIRTIILFLAISNQFLVAAGKSPLPIADAEVELLVSSIWTAVMSVWTWWKNNYISKRGQKQKEVLERNNLYTP